MTNNNSYEGGQNTYSPLTTKGRNKKIITIIIFLVLIIVSKYPISKEEAKSMIGITKYYLGIDLSTTVSNT